MKILFIGSSELSVPFLEELSRSGHSVSLVVTSTDKPAGRGRKVIPNIVKSKAIELGIDFIQIEKFDSNFFDMFKKLKFDTAVVVSFGKILPEKIFELASARWLNVHPSLLPRYRGPTPTISALLNGDKTGGVSIIEVVPEVDAGDIYAQVKFKIEENDNRHRYEQKVIKFGKSMLMTVLELVESNSLKPYPQSNKNVVYSRKITKEDLKINWESSALEIVNKIRAFSPDPGAYCLWKSSRIKILEADIFKKFVNDSCFTGLKADKSAGNGFIIKADKNTGILVICNTSEIVRIKLLQPQDRKVMSAVDFINGYGLKAGENFE